MSAAVTTKRKRQFPMMLMLLVVLLAFFLWAALFEIDQTVRAQGQVILVSRTQIIQAADGGVVSRILVREGESVAAGQLLAELERERPTAAYEENRAKVAALNAALVRARAEAEGSKPRFGKQFDEYPEFVAAQQALFRQRRRGLQEELQTLNDNLSMAQEELNMNEALFETGDTSRLEVMRARRQVGELKGTINAARNKYRQEAMKEATKLVEEISSSRYKLEERQSILGHTELTAPVAGVVKYMKITTIGGVLRAGA